MASLRDRRNMSLHGDRARRQCSAEQNIFNVVRRTFCYDINTRTKPHLNVGTIGHVDHGKTTLTAAITKVRCG